MRLKDFEKVKIFDGYEYKMTINNYYIDYIYVIRYLKSMNKLDCFMTSSLIPTSMSFAVPLSLIKEVIEDIESEVKG